MLDITQSGFVLLEGDFFWLTLKKAWSLVSNQSWNSAANSFSWSWQEPSPSNQEK